MKKFIFNSLTILIAGILGFGVLSCGDSDDENGNGTETENNNSSNSQGTSYTEGLDKLLVGSWKKNYSAGYEIITFRNDETMIRVEYNETDGSDITDGFYSFDTNSMILTIIDEEDEKTDKVISLTANELKLEKWGTYYKTDVTGEEIDDNNNQSVEDNTPTDNRGPVAKSFRGNGTLSNPYIISDAPELRKLSDDVTSGKTYRGEYFKMTADITVNRNVLINDTMLNEQKASTFEQWVPIGTKDTPFCGTFDGNGHSICGIYINQENRDAVGVFGYFAGTITNLKLKDSYVKGNKYCAGYVAFAKIFEDYIPYIEFCYNYARIEGKGHVGGICSSIGKGTISHCVNYGMVIGTIDPSGITGGSGKMIRDCANYGNIIGSHASGIITYSANAKIENCVNFGRITGKNATGVFKGSSNDIHRCNNCVNYGIATFAITNIFREGEMTKTYYLETSASCGYRLGTGNEVVSNSRCKSMTEKEMRQQSFLNELNQNAKALGSDYSLWKFGKDGFPTLEWIEGI